MTTFGPSVLELDLDAESALIAHTLRAQVADLKRRGLVVGLSGGVDSAVCAGLSAMALGPDRVVAVLMPDRDTPADATRRAAEYGRRLGIEVVMEDIDPALETMGCFRRRDEAVRRLFPDIAPGYRAKITLAGVGLDQDRLPYFNLVVDPGDGPQVTRRMPPDIYLQIVAATNMKQRVRTTMLYTHAEMRNHAVVGTPNRLEYALGFFVRGGDGLADVKPIAHLYKSQVYALAAFLDVDEAIRTAVPSTDTYSMQQTQEEFYFGLSLNHVDLLLYALDHDVAREVVAEAMGWSPVQVDRVLRDMKGKRRGATRTAGEALLIRPVPAHS
jgi:NAD+ synthase